MKATMILGAGPGGTGPLIWAAQNGLLREWLAAGVALVDRRSVIGGTLGRYIINSDSLGGAYLECLDAPAGRDFFAPLRDDPSTRGIAAMHDGFPPLDLVSQYLHRLGTLIENAFADSAHSDFRPGLELHAIHLQKDGSVVAELEDSGGLPLFIEARTAIMALGGRQNVPARFQAGGGVSIPLSELDPLKILPSDAILTAGGLAQAEELFRAAGNYKVVILGGAHSAYSAAWAMAQFLPHIPFAADDITIVTRRLPRIFYDSRASAEADSYPVEDGDICPRTARVNRLGGLRGNGRDIWRCMQRCAGVEPETRVRTILLSPDAGRDDQTRLERLLDDAALIVPAFGYRSRTVPVFGPDGQRLLLRVDHGGAAVDQHGRFCLADGDPLPNLFGIGLGTGFVPSGSMGGEPNFRGQANSWWLYQNGIGGTIYHAIHGHLAELRARDLPSGTTRADRKLVAGLGLA